MLTNLLDYLRLALYGVLIAVALLLFQMWQKEHPKAVSQNNNTATISATNNYVPNVTNNLNAVTRSDNTTLNAVPATNTLIHVTTDVMDVLIDRQGGNVMQVKLLQYPETLHSTTPFLLLNDDADTRYLAQSGLLSNSGPDTSKGQAMYAVPQTEYSLAGDQLIIPLTWHNEQGLTVTKTLTFTRGSYEIDVNYQIANQSIAPYIGNLYLQLLRKDTPPASRQALVGMTTYFGAAISSPENHFQKISFKEMQKMNLNQTINGGWAAMIQHYFVSAWVPAPNTTSQYFSRITNDGLYTIGMIGPSIVVQPGATAETSAKLYAGPSIADNLQKVAPGLQRTIDYGWFWFISAPIFWLMQKIYNVIGNWGWSIVLVTIIIKICFYYFSAKSYRSMSAMKNLQPKINSLKERYGDDKQKFTQATIELYRKEKVNPMSGCFPILIQIPFFIGLYWVLIESVQLRQAPFILWIHDLSVHDPYYVLPLLMGLSMFIQQRLNPTPPDPTQAKVMMFMPVIFTVLFMNFPAGLMLYWFVNNTLSFLQQWFIMRSLERHNKTK